MGNAKGSAGELGTQLQRKNNPNRNRDRYRTSEATSSNRKNMASGNEKLEVYHLAIGYVAWVFEHSEKWNGVHRLRSRFATPSSLRSVDSDSDLLAPSSLRSVDPDETNSQPGAPLNADKPRE